ncbi:MAG: serine/threonine protein kinase, bacterial [Blastocatellia bacterium]|jgi:serine/threonine protein kinase|nr:serine/threonine protein kinase, bacterial [Blastocatellia bacterium]
MNSLDTYLGQTLDDKYRLERLLGQGGMGAVYLATHLGTDRYVALKLITPQFMRNEEFVERFKREARAAGRLRHPNVVDVTDFGFARAGKDSVAYLVMEYLDGCTLSDVLAEEKRLPLYWVVDILEQVCSAVQEAHHQGIVHRDLKPDNIWLEPNALGGYRVKVLDFGIAKLGDVANPAGEAAPELPLNHNADDTPTIHFSESPATTAAAAPAKVNRAPLPPLANLESETMVQSPVEDFGDARATQLAHDDGRATQLIEPDAGSTHGGSDNDQTKILGEAAPHTVRAAPPGYGTTDASSTAATTGLTRVGAILGTPLYMSPEQCRGENLDARSDIYSLGIIAYQMLAGSPPFTGETTSVIHAHTGSQPKPLREHDAKLPKRVSRVVMSALEKEPAARPQTAIAFAHAMRANADGLGALYRRAFALYSEYFPKFLKLSLLAHIPTIVITLMLIGFRLTEPRMGKVVKIAVAIPLALMQIAAGFVTPSIISGVTAIIVTQLAVAPLKPVELRAAFAVLRRRWRPFLNTGIRITLRILLGFCLFIIPGIVMAVRYSLWAPVVLIEGLEKKEARLRARSLASRSWRTILLVMLFQFLVPTIVGGALAALLGANSNGKGVRVKVFQPLTSLVNIFVLPLMSIVPALLYLKMRQFGGETLNDVMSQLEEEGGARSKWQQRMRHRLTSVNTPHSRA